MIIRVLAIVGGVALAYFIFKLISKPSEFRRCGRCEGRGYWHTARERETCDWCHGSGKLPNNDFTRNN